MGNFNILGVIEAPIPLQSGVAEDFFFFSNPTCFLRFLTSKSEAKGTDR